MTKKERYSQFEEYALSETEAKHQGFDKLTLPYKEAEVQMLEKVIKDMSNVPFAVVNTRYGYEVWRKGMISEKEAELRHKDNAV